MIKPFFKRPLFFSLIAHLFLLSALIIMPTKAPTKKRLTKVHTVRLQPKKAPEKVAAPKAKKPVSKPKPQVKATKKKVATKKAKTPTKKTPKKRTQKPAPKKEISASRKNAQPLLALPAVFQKNLLTFFEERLEMPEMGRVSLKLTFNKLGKIDKVEVLFSESRKNELYLLKALKHLNLPHPQKGSFEPLVVEFGNALRNP